jgi:predicted dehydrogenase
VVVSFPLRTSPLYELARDAVANHRVGEPEHITAVNYVPYGLVYWEEGYRNYEITQGLFLQKATHDFDYILNLMGQGITKIAARANLGRIFGGDKPAGLTCSVCDEQESCKESPVNRKRNGSAWRNSDDHNCVFSVDLGNPQTGINEDCSSALFEFENGTHGVYSQVFFSRRDSSRRGAVVSGYEGTLDFDWYRNEMRLVRHHQPFTDTVRAGEGMSHFGGDIELGYDFIDCINRRGTPRTTIMDGIQSVYVCLAAKKSVETGQFETVRQTGQIS